MEYTSQSSHGRIAQSCYHQEIPTDDPRSHSWSDNHLYYPNNNSSLITSPVEIHALPVLSQAPTWQNNPTNLSQDIHGFLDSRQTSHEPWTGHPRAMNHEQLWSHSFPGATAPMSDPGQDLHNTHQYNGASLISPADSAYQSFESTKSQPINHMQHHPFEHSSTPRYQTDSPHLQNFISGPTVAESVVSAPVVTTRGYQGSNSRQIGRNSRSRAAVTPCSICHKVLKNPSDAQKHYFTHSKPFRCEVMGCTRQEGFATQNDLQRHRKAVHGLNPTVGKKTGYICAACGPSSAGGSPKFWPRRDNFKAHCNRKHKDWDEQLLLQQSEMHKSFDTISKSGYVSAPSQIDPFENLYSQEFSELMESNFPEQVAQQGDYTPFNFQNRSDDEELAGIGAGTSADPSLGNRASDAGLHDPSWKGRHGLLELSNAAESVGKLAGDMDHQTLRSPVGYDELSNLHISQQNLPNKDSTVQWTRSPQESSQGTTLSIEKSVPVAKHADGEFVCKHCKKRKKRECDLTKHLKRHSRPYGCTFPGCSKRFGSRNDWKRHENSQHFLQEMYHCVMMGLDGKPCNQHFGRKEAVVLHLQSPRHKIPPTEIEPEVELTRLGRNGHKRFWCGFCGKLVSSQGEPHRAWDYRSQHIGDHFDKEHMSIEQWMCMEENKFKGDIVPPAKKSGRRPQLRSVDAFEEDSDLGEDGIPEPVYVLSTIQTKQMSDHDDDDKEKEEEEEVKFMSDDEDQFGAMNWDQ